MASYDICIIGSGPAGLILGDELSKSGRKICLIESGGMDYQKSDKSLKKIISTGEIKIRENSRERAWGGTSTTWTGLSAPLDPIDFELWPIKYADLEKYYDDLAGYGFPRLKDFQSKPSRFFSRLQEKTFILIHSPLDFGQRLKNLLETTGVDILLDSTVTRINKQGEGIESVSVTSKAGAETEVKSKIFVICAGGLESTRLLLISNIGNEYGRVGKYLMNHPKNNFGSLKLTKPTNALSHLRLVLRENLQKELGLLNSYILLEPVLPKTLVGQLLHKIKISSVTELQIRNFMDMEPVESNVMTLSNELDIYGNPLPIVNLNTTERDRKSLINLHEIFGQEVESLGLGHFTSYLEATKPWPIIAEASHHLGGTVMGTDVKRSVVNQDLRVHSEENLYVCSGSVFPTGGSANPTYTICALALKLADHLKTTSF